MSSANSKVKKILKTVGNVFFYCFITFLAIVICISIYCKKTNKLVFKYSILWVLTDSMEPEIQAHSYIIVKRIDYTEVEMGDIISFRSTDPAIYGSLNTHEVIRYNDTHTGFITRGTHVGIDDEFDVPFENVEAKFVKKMPLLTFIGRWFTTKAGLAMTLILVTSGISVYSYFLLKNEKKKQEDEEFERRVQAEIKRLEKEGLNKEN